MTFFINSKIPTSVLIVLAIFTILGIKLGQANLDFVNATLKREPRSKLMEPASNRIKCIGGYGTYCKSSADCCQGYCDIGSHTCWCRYDKATCEQNEDCCHGLCHPERKMCYCLKTGTPTECSSNQECCSHNCHPDHGICYCKSYGIKCEQDRQCCSNKCSNGECDDGCNLNDRTCSPTKKTKYNYF